MVIKRIGVLKAGVFQACFMALLGLVFGLGMLMFGTMLGGLFGASHSGMGMMGVGMGIGMVIFLPIMYGVIGFIAGAIGAFLYNLVAGWIGGIEMDVDLAAPAVTQL